MDSWIHYEYFYAKIVITKAFALNLQICNYLLEYKYTKQYNNMRDKTL